MAKLTFQKKKSYKTKKKQIKKKKNQKKLNNNKIKMILKLRIYHTNQYKQIKQKCLYLEYTKSIQN